MDSSNRATQAPEIRCGESDIGGLRSLQISKIDTFFVAIMFDMLIRFPTRWGGVDFAFCIHFKSLEGAPHMLSAGIAEAQVAMKNLRGLTCNVLIKIILETCFWLFLISYYYQQLSTLVERAYYK